MISTCHQILLTIKRFDVNNIVIEQQFPNDVSGSDLTELIQHVAQKTEFLVHRMHPIYGLTTFSINANDFGMLELVALQTIFELHGCKMFDLYLDDTTFTATYDFATHDIYVKYANPNTTVQLL